MLGCKIQHSPPNGKIVSAVGMEHWTCLEHSGSLWRIKAVWDRQAGLSTLSNFLARLSLAPDPVPCLVLLLFLLWTQVFPTKPCGQETANCQQQRPSKHHQRTLLFVLLFVILAPKLDACYVPKLLPRLGRIYWYNWAVFRPVNYIQWSRYSFQNQTVFIGP